MAPRPELPDDDTGPDDTDVPADGSAPEPSEPDEEDDDARWADIVARLQADEPTGMGEQVHDHVVPGPAVTYPVAPHRADQRVVRPARDHADVPDDDGWGDDRAAGRSGRDWDGTAQIDDAERAVDDHEHYVPPDPGPVLGGDPLLTTAWLAVVGMPILWLVVLIAWRGAPHVVLQASGVVFVLGLGLLLWRMPHRRDSSDDDTGAVV